MAETLTQGVKGPDGSPLFPFDSDHPEFARGFEAGAVWLQLAVRPTGFEAVMANENLTMAQRMARASGRSYTVDQSAEAISALLQDDTSLVLFGGKGTAPELADRELPDPLDIEEPGPDAPII